jgi:hypothetical protein
MRTMKVVLPAALAIAGFLVFNPAGYSKQEYARKENQKCGYCHTKVEAKEAMAKNLTNAGKYYKSHNHTLDGYKGK